MRLLRCPPSAVGAAAVVFPAVLSPFVPVVPLLFAAAVIHPCHAAAAVSTPVADAAAVHLAGPRTHVRRRVVR